MMASSDDVRDQLNNMISPGAVIKVSIGTRKGLEGTVGAFTYYP